MENLYGYLAFGFKKSSNTEKEELFMAPVSELPSDLLAGSSVKSGALQPLEQKHFASENGDRYDVWLADASSLCASPARLSHFKELLTSLCASHTLPSLSQSTRIHLSALLQPILNADFSSSDLTTFYDITRSLSFREQNRQYLSDLSDIYSQLGLLQVTRERQSITQGLALVTCNGHPLVRYGDDIYLKQEDGTYTNGHRRPYTDASQALAHHGPVINGWGSITPDSTFMETALLEYAPRMRLLLQQPSRESVLAHTRALLASQNIDLRATSGYIELPDNDRCIRLFAQINDSWSVITRDGRFGPFRTEELSPQRTQQSLDSYISGAEARRITQASHAIPEEHVL